MGTRRKEWDCCGSVTETEAWEPEACPFCADEAAPFRKDAERYRYYRARVYKDGSTLALDVGVIDDVAVGDFGEFIDATADAAIAAGAAAALRIGAT